MKGPCPNCNSTSFAKNELGYICTSCNYFLGEQESLDEFDATGQLMRARGAGKNQLLDGIKSDGLYTLKKQISDLSKLAAGINTGAFEKILFHAFKSYNSAIAEYAEESEVIIKRHFRIVPVAISFLGLMWLREAYLETDISRWLCQGQLTLYKTTSSAQDHNFHSGVTHPDKILRLATSISVKLNIPLPAPRVPLIIKRLFTTLKIPGPILERALFLYNKYFEEACWQYTDETPIRVQVIALLIVAVKTFYNVLHFDFKPKNEELPTFRKFLSDFLNIVESEAPRTVQEVRGYSGEMIESSVIPLCRVVLGSHVVNKGGIAFSKISDIVDLLESKIKKEEEKIEEEETEPCEFDYEYIKYALYSRARTEQFSEPYTMLLKLCGYYVFESHMEIHRSVLALENKIFAPLSKNKPIKVEQ